LTTKQWLAVLLCPQIRSNTLFDDIVALSVNRTMAQEVMPEFAGTVFFERYLAFKVQ
jgi:hypothetical protein